MIGDPDRTVADLYDMVHPNANDTMTVRSVFVIGPDKKVKLTITYPASTGRNFDEILRVIDSLQLTANYKVATPANWTDGDDVIIGSAVTDEEAEKLFPQGWTTVKPYLARARSAQQVVDLWPQRRLSPGRRQLLAQHEAQTAPCVVDRADLVVDPTARQQVFAQRVLGDVGRHDRWSSSAMPPRCRRRARRPSSTSATSRSTSFAT